MVTNDKWSFSLTRIINCVYGYDNVDMMSQVSMHCVAEILTVASRVADVPQVRPSPL